MRTYDTVDEVMLDAINKTRPMTQSEFMERLDRVSKRAGVVLTYPQIRAAGKRLLAAKKIELIHGAVRRLV